MPVGTPPAPETVAVNVTFIPTPGVADEAVSTVALATGTGAGTTVKEREAVAVAGVLSASAGTPGP